MEKTDPDDYEKLKSILRELKKNVRKLEKGKKKKVAKKIDE